MLDIKALLTKLVNHYNTTATVYGEIGSKNGTLVSDQWTSSKSLSSSTTAASLGVDTYITSTKKITLTKGVWLAIGECRFVSSSSGRRFLQMYYDKNDGNGMVSIGVARSQRVAGTTGAISLIVCSYLECPNDGWNLDLYAYQNSGSAQSITWYMQLVRLK